MDNHPYAPPGGETLLRVPPQSLDAEQSVLGGIFLKNDAYYDVSRILCTDDFYRENHKKIFMAMTELFKKGEPVDIITLTDALKKTNSLEDVGGLPMLTGLVDNIPSAANIKYYATIVKEKSELRQIILACADSMSEAYEAGRNVSVVRNELMGKLNEINMGGSGVVHIKEAIKIEFDRIEKQSKTDKRYSGMQTRYYAFNQLFGGVQRKALYIIAGRPSSGKTAFAVNILKDLAEQGGVLVISADQSNESFAGRLLSLHGDINNIRLRDGVIRDDEWTPLVRVAGELSNLPVYIRDGSMTLMDMVSTIHMCVEKYKIKTVIVDYVQIAVDLPGKDRNELELGEVTRVLKGVAIKLDLAMIHLAQLNRESEKRTGNKPKLSDISHSGRIEQDANVVILMHKEKRGNSVLLIVAKNKDGPTGEIEMTLHGPTYRMEEG